MKKPESVLIIGSGPIVIGQGAEFDYSGTQACKVLRQEGIRVILVNSNPATIMTDPELADATYIEPITASILEEVIKKEKPTALLPTMGGQTGLNVAVELAESGFLEEHGVKLIGAQVEAIKKAEDRELFKKAAAAVGLNVPIGDIATTWDEAEKLIGEIGFPAIIRSAFTLGGVGGSTAYNIEEYKDYVERGLAASPISEVMIEQSIIGWKEYELEVMRDRADNVVIVCSIENFDPMGVHTGDSITVAPQQTLSDVEYQEMRDKSIALIREIGVETGGSNIQFAVHPGTGEMMVIEMNPRVSRSSALASKATGFPIAKIAAQLAIGYTLDQITNDITGETPASFEPTLDYVVVKVPRWDFEKFPKADKSLGVQMKAVGEVMAFGRNFREALQKALRSLEIGRSGLEEPSIHPLYYDADGKMKRKIKKNLTMVRSQKIFDLRAAFIVNMTIEEIYELTKIDPWFLNQIRLIVEVEKSIAGAKGKNELESEDFIRQIKEHGFSDVHIASLIGTTEQEFREKRKKLGVKPVYKTVDTCAAEFRSNTPYMYSTYELEEELEPSDKKKVIILGSGPNRIGQGVEFDYCCVHAVMALREEGFEVSMINCNPETVSTDYDTTDKLFFEPLTFEDVMNVVDAEKPDGVIIQFGGQTPLKLAKALKEAGCNIYGTTPENIDLAEDREKFGQILNDLNIKHPEYGVAYSVEESVEVAKRIGFPALVRPSYVLGGRGMEIAYDRESIREFMKRAAEVSPEHPVFIDNFLEGATEFDVDAIYDGERVLIGGIMQHIEEAGIHSGDSACVLPPYRVSSSELDTIKEYTEKIAKALDVRGLLNVQYATKEGEVFVIEANPRGSRTVPFVSKATGVPLAKIAAKVAVGITLREQGIGEPKELKHISIKEPVFPFTKFPGISVYGGPEMRSTGEVMGISFSFGEAFAKSFWAKGHKLPESGGVFLSVNDNDKRKVVEIARDFSEMGFELIATSGTCKLLKENGLNVKSVFKVAEDRPNVVDLVVNGEINLIINTPLGRSSRFDERAIGDSAIRYQIPCITTLSGAEAAVRGIRALKSGGVLKVKSLQEYNL
ncbi:carbamoyl-phosphate synthase large subunit [Candidatus Marinimicrobia bacterium MT.SAG.3]|nr:carbamoyl-phosphate synthase large subunit [Candidatus Marinimicrobia bacterium MT.SAG.3]